MIIKCKYDIFIYNIFFKNDFIREMF
jgi:hypothetical protein